MVEENSLSVCLHIPQKHRAILGGALLLESSILLVTWKMNLDDLDLNFPAIRSGTTRHSNRQNIGGVGAIQTKGRHDGPRKV